MNNVVCRMRIFVIASVVLILSCIALAQDARTSAPAPRFASVIEQYLKQDSTQPPAKGTILFVGSSIFRKWTRLTEQMAPLPVFNRAFGGSRTAEVLYYMDRIVLPYEPAIIVYYCGSNDINAGERPRAIFGRFKEFSQRVQARLPQTHLLYVSINRAPQKKVRWDLVDSTNTLVREYCAVAPRHIFIDVNPVLFDAGGQPRLDMYVSDQLHLTDKAYEEYTTVIKPVVERVWRMKRGE
jgi:hypothetical protein